MIWGKHTKMYKNRKYENRKTPPSKEKERKDRDAGESQLATRNVAETMRYRNRARYQSWRGKSKGCVGKTRGKNIKRIQAITVYKPSAQRPMLEGSKSQHQESKRRIFKS